MQIKAHIINPVGHIRAVRIGHLAGKIIQGLISASAVFSFIGIIKTAKTKANSKTGFSAFFRFFCLSLGMGKFMNHEL